MRFMKSVGRIGGICSYGQCFSQDPLTESELAELSDFLDAVGLPAMNIKMLDGSSPRFVKHELRPHSQSKGSSSRKKPHR